MRTSHNDPIPCHDATGRTSSKIVGSVLSVSDEDAFEYACRIWFDAPGRRAAQELRSLPSVERERVWADLTGQPGISQFASSSQEDPAMVQQAFDEIRKLLSQPLPDPLGSALHLKPDYIGDPNYLIRFLRAKEFDVPSALDCLNKHLKMKVSLFGEDCLTRDILLSDLSPDDLQFMKRGVYQYLNETDRAGRAVSFLNFADPYYTNKKMHSVLRTMFYLNTVATESESVQRLGIVRVGYFHQSYPRGGPDQDLIRMSVQMIEAVPIRSVALYLVAGSSLWSQTMDLIVLLARPWLRVRTRIVSGSYFENLYSLLCLGVPKASFPALEDGTISTENVSAWIEQRMAIERHHKGGAACARLI